MCGLIAAAWHGEVRRDAIASACARMRSRGPDAEGFWHGEGVSLGHRRLAILDLDARAHQPMYSACGRYSIVYNGEIYNFRELRGELESQGAPFRTSSDTEVLLALFSKEKERMLPKLRGMFAFAIWDAEERKLFVARDPFGIKPLYLAETREGVLAASQVKALLASGLVGREPDAVGQAGFWLTGSVPEPHTWYRGVRALPAGSFAWIRPGSPLATTRWWDVGDSWRQAKGAELPDQEIRDRVHSALRESVQAHLVSDVPIGVFLSGGIDSGVLAGLMRQGGAHGIQGVTIAFREFAGRHEDEAPVAARIAAGYGIAHHVRIVTREEFEADLPRILDAMDQPTVDGVNTWYASKAVAEQGLKVVVSGLGGDEIFQGYRHFRVLPRLVAMRKAARHIPGAGALIRLVSAVQARRTGNRRWLQLPELAGSLTGAWLLRRGLFSTEELPQLMGVDLSREALRGFEGAAWVAEQCGALPRDPRIALSLIESVLYLRNQLLRDSDWASMAHGVELRTPYVDSWLLRDLAPVSAAFGRFEGKSLLSSATPDLPRDVVSRTKTGFDTPIHAWVPQSDAGRPNHPTRAWARLLAQRYGAYGNQPQFA